jgi:hypothetical protein
MVRWVSKARSDRPPGDVAVVAVRRLVDVAQDVARLLDVGDDELLVDRPRRASRARELDELVVVVLGAEDRRLKMVGLEVTPRSESSSMRRRSSPLSISQRRISSSQMLVPAAVRRRGAR